MRERRVSFLMDGGLVGDGKALSISRYRKSYESVDKRPS